jgi:GDPmannose 4,6-dehydratase
VNKKAFVTGVAGQDGSYLAELLLDKSYDVHGLLQIGDSNPRNVEGLREPFQGRFFLHEGDLMDRGRMANLFQLILPDEVYNLAAQSYDDSSPEMVVTTAEINGLGPLYLMESLYRMAPDARFFQASSSEIFGSRAEVPQSETTPLRPQSPYGVAKELAHRMVEFYRTAQNKYAVNGILFNHESPRRGEIFVTRKITRGLALILAGKQEKLRLGRLDTRRDWGYAGDYVRAMWLMLQQNAPQDFVIATGESHTIQEFLGEAFSYVGLDYQKFIETDPAFTRALEVRETRGDPSKITKALGWKPEIDFRQLVRLMVDSDLKAVGLKTPSLDPT